MNFIKKLFSKKTNLIISVVALVECIILLGLTTFAWIESASSLIINGENLVITSGYNYEFNIVADSQKKVDLSTYFSDTSNFSLASASSVDGKSFYFPYTVDGENTVYREGDTTDYNTTYYNIDFNAHNSDSSKIDFYFYDDNIFSFKDSGISYTDENGSTVNVTKDEKDAFLESFRLAITTGTTTTVYSKTGDETQAVSAKSGTKDSQRPVAFSTRTYGENNKTSVFNVDTGGNTQVNVKVWYENSSAVNDLATAAMMGSIVNINFSFVCTSSKFNTLEFKDYSLFTGQTDSDNSLYYFNSGKYYPMIITQTTRDCYVWQTSDESDSPIDSIPDGLVLADGCFIYGKLTSKNFTELCRWELDNNNGSYVYQAVSATKTSENTIAGYGYWSGTTLATVKFVDRTTYASKNNYNAGATKFINEDQLYVYGSNTPIKMNYFNDYDTYEAHVPRTWLNNSIHFYYTQNAYYNESQVRVHWNAPYSQTDMDTYTAIGYTNEAYLDDLTSTANSPNGIGTWGEVERINLSAELVDSSVFTSPGNLFRVSYREANDYQNVYMASSSGNPFSYYAYVPVDTYSFDYGALGQNKITWSNCVKPENNSTFYITEDGSKAGTTPSGLWNLAVFVDGTVDNLVNDTLTDSENTGATLEYSLDGVNFNPMQKVDNYRWRTDDISNSSEVTFRWIPYGQNTAFEYTEFTHELTDISGGINYVTVTEYGTIIKK